jgi:uncharacterized protein YbaR (Trm112 family)
MSSSSEPQVISLKADRALWEALDGIDNRSQFIRNAFLMAIDNVCPLCGGTGLISASQRNHLEGFLKNHEVIVCKECNQRHLTCSQTRKKEVS